MSGINQFNQVIFPSALLLQAINQPDSKYNDIWLAELWILGIASAAYLLLSQITNQERREDLRYIDWLLTTPALIYILWRFAQINGWAGNGLALISAPVIMVIAGYLAKQETPYRNLFLILSFLALAFILYQVYLISKFLLEERGIDLGPIPWFFYLGWTAYGLIFFAPINARDNLYAALDLINKVIFALTFNLLLLN